MKRTAQNFVVMIFALQTVVLCAQVHEKATPKFTLTLSNGGVDAWGGYVLAVTETNISNEVIREGGCLPLAFKNGVNITVVYNGVNIKMDETKPMVLHFRKHRAQPVPCSGSVSGHEAKPGGGPESSFEDNVDISLLYDMSKPGTYEITVSKETFPHDPDKSVTVKSNTLTIVVPEAGGPILTTP